MCVIIHRPAGHSLPFNKLATACEKNAHGMGVAIFDRGRLEIRKIFSEKGNDPEILAKILEDAIDQEVFVHLRLKSIGDKNPENVHPFIVHKDGDRTFALMHNGTMNQFDRKNGKTDSETFGMEIFKPLVSNWKSDNPLLDPDFQRIVSIAVGNDWNKIALLDSNGSHFIINKGKGSTFPGNPDVWVSNDHSFESFFREGVWTPKGTVQEKTTPLKTTPPTAGPSETPTGQSITVPGGQSQGAQSKALAVVVHPTKIKKEVRPSFLQGTTLKSLEELRFLTEDDVNELIETYPEHAALLILDLLDEVTFGDEGEFDEDEEANSDSLVSGD